METLDNTNLWSRVVEAAGLSLPEKRREAFQALASEIQELVGTLRGAGLNETPPSFTFRAQ